MIMNSDECHSGAMNAAMCDRGEFMKRLSARQALTDDECSCGHAVSLHGDDGCRGKWDDEECPCGDYVP